MRELPKITQKGESNDFSEKKTEEKKKDFFYSH